jgi:hypothetical protein
MKSGGCVGHVDKGGYKWWGHGGEDGKEERYLCRAYVLTQRRVRRAAYGFFG